MNQRAIKNTSLSEWWFHNERIKKEQHGFLILFQSECSVVLVVKPFGQSKLIISYKTAR